MNLCCRGWSGNNTDEERGTGVEGGLFTLQVLHGMDPSILSRGSDRFWPGFAGLKEFIFIITSQLWPFAPGAVDPAAEPRTATTHGITDPENELNWRIQSDLKVNDHGGTNLGATCGVENWIGDKRPVFKEMSLSPPGFNSKVYDSTLTEPCYLKNCKEELASVIEEARNTTGCQITMGPDYSVNDSNASDENDWETLGDMYWHDGPYVQNYLEMAYFGFPHEVSQAKDIVDIFIGTQMPTEDELHVPRFEFERLSLEVDPED